MAKRGTPVNSMSPSSVWRRGLVLAAFTLTSGLCMMWIAEKDWTPIGQPVRLSRLHDAELAPHLRALIRQGTAELARVVEALGAERSALQSAAARTLHEEVGRCAQAPADAAAWQLDGIARALAMHAPQFKDEALATAAALAERILAVPMRAGNNSDRLRHCHIVLKEVAERRMEEQARSLSATSKSASITHDRAKGPGAASRTSVAVTAAPLAGGGLVVAPVDTQPRPLPQQVMSQAKPLSIPDNKSSNAASTSQLNSPSRVRASASNASHASNETIMTAWSGPTLAADKDQRNSQTGAANGVQSAAAGQAKSPIPRDLARLLEVAERVRFGSSPQSAATKAELLWLGIDEAQLKLARGAVDDDPRVRQEVVEALAQFGTVDARGWLLWLSYDRDAGVRRAAISLLATASDPELKKRVRQAADSDADQRVRDQARAASVASEAQP